jgi:LysM domain
MVSVRRVAPVLLLLMALPAFAQKQSSTPPRELRLEGDHYTAWNPPDPATYPAGAKTHKIVAGDTLWALAQQYYGNAYLWPQLWESNTWITDAHWIYPGDILLVEGEGAAQTAEGTAGDATLGSGTGTTDENAELGTGTFTDPSGTGGGLLTANLTRETNPLPLGAEVDIYCYGYIGQPNEAMPNYFESIEDVEVMYVPRLRPWHAASVAEGDLIYIRGGSATGLVAGETYMAIEPGDMIYHPHTGALIGQHYNYQGQIRIICTEPNQSRAIVEKACREINVGARLKPIPQLPIPIARVPNLPAWCDPPTSRTTGTIIDSRDWDLELAEGILVQVDLGAEGGLQPGDFLTVWRPSPRSDQPRQVLGEIGILTTQARTSTGIIVAMRRTMQIGDYVEAR